MATKIKHKRSSVPGKKPIVSQIESGELALNTADGKVFLLKDDNTVQDLTQKIFENNTRVEVNDPGDSQGTITANVDGSDKMIITDSTINVYEDVDMENATGITFRELTASGDDGITLKAPDNLPNSYTLKLPFNNGTVGQVIKTNGLGQLEFSDADTFGGNTIYVSSEQGDDVNNGQSAPVKTVKRACQLASALVYNVDGTPNGTRINVKVAVGDYTEQNPIIVPDNVVIKGDGLRGCIIRPANANQDILRVRNACYFGEFTFRDGVDVNFVPLITADYAVAFDDPDDIFTSRVGYTNLPTTKPTITTSPYIQNCSIISFLGMNGAKIDGTKVNSPNVPVISIEAENPVIGATPEQGKSMVANAYTHISFGGTGWRLTNDAYAQLVSCFQIFLLNGVYCQSGGYCSITNSATNFGLYALRASGFSPKAFLFDRAFVVGTGVSEGQQTLTIVGINRESPVEQYIIKFRDPEYRLAHDRLIENKIAIAQDTVDWINAQIAGATPGSLWDGFTYNESKCYRDTLLIVEAVAKDTWDTGNRYTRSVGLAYYNKNLQDSSAILISGQEDQTIAAIEQASVYAATYISDLDSTVRSFVDEKFDIVKDIIGNPDNAPNPTEVSSEGDVTNSFKPAPTATEFDAAADVNATTNIFTILGHGFSNAQKVIYDPNGNSPIRGLDAEQTYYVKIVNNDEFTLAFDESLDFNVDVIATSTGTHKILSNVQEFFVNEIISSHQTYQTLILESGAESYEFVPGRAIVGTTGANNNSAFVYSWEPTERRLVVSVELVAVGSSTQRVQFNNTSIITSDHADVPNTSITVNEVAARTGLGTSTFSITGTVDGAALTNLVNLLEKQVWFHRPSIVNSSGHTWEYAGSGTDYNALPQNGGNTRVEYEQFSELPGRVYSSGTNELGDFKVGNFITAFNRTGNITFRNKVTVDELDVLRLAFSDIVIEEISQSVNLGDDEIGGPTNNRLTTQLAIRSFLSNRLGGFIDKTVSTAAVPGAIVQLNTNGQLNAELIPATRQFTNTTTDGYLSRLGQIDEIPAVDLKAGDIATEEYEQIELTFASGVTAADGDLIQQAVTGARGYAKGSYSSSLNVLVASVDREFKAGDDSTGTDFDTTNVISVNGVSTGQAPTVLGSSSAITDNFFLKSSNTSQFLILDPDETYTFTTASISTVARSTNVATIVTTTNHNLNAGNTVQILCNDDTTFNINGIVISAPTGTSFTIANTGSTVTTTSVTGTVRTIVTSADGNAQGAVTETRYGVLTNVDNANITGGSGYVPALGTQVYEFIPLISLTGTGSGAIADVTVTAGAVTDVDIRRGGIGYSVGDMLTIDSTDLTDGTSTGSSFVIDVSAIENRAYVNILGGELFVASPSSVDFVEDNTAITSKITVTLTDTISNNFLAGDIGSGGNVDYATSRITITAHGLTSGNPVTYDTLSNVAIGGLLNGSVYYAKRISDNIIELYNDYSLLSKVSFLSTPANNNHNLTRFQVNITDNSVIVPAHGLVTGDAVRVVGSTLFEINSDVVTSGSRFFVGSVTTNSFTLHDLRSNALSSINGLVTSARNITATGSGSADFIANNVRVSSVVNTSSSEKTNWNSLAVTNIDASNIISGTVSPTRLASSGTANTDTFLRGDSSYQTVVQSIKKANTTDNPITLTGSNVAGEFYGDPVNIGISNVNLDVGQTYSTLGVVRFLQTQFDVDSSGTGQVFIKDGVVDAGTLDGLDSSYFLNPANLTSAVPVSRGGTNLTTYAVGDMLFATSSGTLNTLNIGRNKNILRSSGTAPEWVNALDISEGLDVGSATLASLSTGTGQIYNANVTTLELGSDAENVKIGKSTSTRSITSFVANYNATISQNVVVNLESFTKLTNSGVLTGGKEVPMANTSGIIAGMIVTGSGSIPVNTTVSGVTDEYIYFSNVTTGTITSGTTLTFTYTPLALGIRAGDTVNIASSTVTNLDGSWPVIGATANATSFTIQTDANVTANPATPKSGTITKDNTMVIRNRRVIFGSAEGSAAPVDATLRGEDGIGTNVAGGDIIVQPGLGTGNAVGGDFVVKTGTSSTSSDFKHTSATRLTIDTSGKSTFTGEVGVAGTLSTSATTVNVVNTTATTANFAGAATALTIGATTGTATIRNASVVLSGDLEVQGGDLTTNQTTFNLLNATATTVNAFGAATALTIGATTGTATIRNASVVLSGDLEVQGGDLTTNQTTFNLLNATATTVNAFGAATTLTIGQTSGTTTVRNNLTTTLDLAVNGGDITTTATTFNLVNANATTVNAFGAATTLTIGQTSGTTTVRNNLTTTLDLAVNGGDITTTATTFNLVNANATTVNFAGGASSVVIGAATSVVRFTDDVDVDGNLNVDGPSTFTNSTVSTNTTSGAVVITGGVGVGGNLHVGGTLNGNGSGLTTLDASNLSSGTVPSARMTGSYTGITGTGALDAGQITSGFGSINIGTDIFTGNGSGLTNVDAATLDGIDSASFVRSDATDTVTGLITTSLSGEQMRFGDSGATGSPFISLYQTTTRRGYIQYVNGGTFRIRNEGSASGIDFSTGTTGLQFFDGTNTSTVWHAANDGSGSGLDADTVDGIDSGSFLRSDANDTFSGTLSGTGSINITGNVAATNFTGNGSGLTNITGTDSTKLPLAGGTLTGQLISTLANSTATGGGQIYLNGATGNRIDFNTNGVAAPAFTTRSAGTKVVYYPGIAAAASDYAVGINTSTLWHSVPTTAEAFRWFGGTTQSAVLTGAGAFTATNEVTAYSDARIKDNITVIADPLTKVLNIRGVNYTRTDLEDKDRVYMGVVAQEIEQYVPEVVTTLEDGTKTVNYGAMAGLFIEVFKEQQKQIDELRAMVQKLADK